VIALLMMMNVNSIELITAAGHHTAAAATTIATSHCAAIAHDYNRTLRLITVTSRFKHAHHTHSKF